MKYLTLDWAFPSHVGSYCWLSPMLPRLQLPTLYPVTVFKDSPLLDWLGSAWRCMTGEWSGGWHSVPAGPQGQENPGSVTFFFFTSMMQVGQGLFGERASFFGKKAKLNSAYRTSSSQTGSSSLSRTLPSCLFPLWLLAEVDTCANV